MAENDVNGKHVEREAHNIAFSSDLTMTSHRRDVAMFPVPIFVYTQQVERNTWSDLFQRKLEIFGTDFSHLKNIQVRTS